MAYDFTPSTQWLNSTSPPVTAAPLTIACWFYPDNVTTDQILVGLSDSASSTHGFFIRANGAAAGPPADPIQAAIGIGGSLAGPTSTSGYTANAWHHGCAVYASATSRTVYLNGGSSASTTDSRTPTGINDLSIGRLTRGTPGLYTNGKIAEVGIWSAALDAAEIAVLAKGYSPLLVRPGNLVFYAPLVRGLHDHKGLILTNNGSTPVADHPWVIYPKRRQVFGITAAAGVSIATGLGELALAGYAPDIRVPLLLDAGLGQLALAGYEPTVSATSSSAPILSLASVSSVTATTAVPRVTLTFS